MKIEEFNMFKEVKDKLNPYCNLYYIDEDTSFYIEPIFYRHMLGIKERIPNEYPKVINKIISLAKENKKVVFTGNYESPYTDVEGYIFLEIDDILDPLHIYLEDKSRGSDYGD